MNTLKNYILGEWREGEGTAKELFDASTGEAIYNLQTGGIDFESMIQYGRKNGHVLRNMTFQERGLMIKKLALHLHKIKDKYYPISYQTGATKVDSWIDIEGGIGNLFAYSSLRKKFPNSSFFVDGETVGLSKGGTFSAQHIMVPKPGVAVHINAFNFPIWGMLEKCAVNWLAGMPAIVKPATLTCYLTEAMVKDIIASGILPEGALQLICGSARGIVDYLGSQDVVTFTGSATTGRFLKANENIINNAVPFNMEADSLNCSVLGADSVPGTPEFDLFIKEVRNEMTVKSGQKCTAIRRIIVPEALVEDVGSAMAEALGKVKIGDPRAEGVRMGALAGKEQVKEVKERVAQLMEHASMVYGDVDEVATIGDKTDKGSFISPILMRQDNPFQHINAHSVEAFGPVSTIMPYKDMGEAIELANMGKGSLVSSIVTNDPKTARHYVMGSSTYHGRILVLNRDCAKESTGHGSPMPMLTHGGPGRAGGGEEMGGMRGVMHYLQRCAIQGSPSMLTEITDVYQYGGTYKDPGKHVFQKHFEELVIGDTIITGKRTITETDIVNFANVSWDHFYAHTDVTSLEGTIFEERVAHGYFILSAAAGLFVSAPKGPVLLNYGLEEFRFTKPVYAGTTIGVRLTVKEKITQEKREDDDIAKGIVKFLVDVYDQEGETVAIGTILTMVKMLEE